MTPRSGGHVEASARLAKARQFADAAALLYDDTAHSTDHPDAYVTQAVHAGIAAADVVCIRRLGEYQASGAHQEAIALLKRADADASKHLARLLSLKSKAGYSANPASGADVAAARRAHLALLEAAESL